MHRQDRLYQTAATRGTYEISTEISSPRHELDRGHMRMLLLSAVCAGTAHADTGGTDPDVTVTVGDGGAILAWQSPLTASNPLYEVSIQSAGLPAIQVATPTTEAVIAGLVDGSNYTATVTEYVSGTAVWSGATQHQFEPQSMPQSDALLGAIGALLNAQDAIEVSPTSSVAEVPEGNNSVISGILTNMAPLYRWSAAQMAKTDQYDARDATEIQNAAVFSSGGSAVQVYASTDERFTTLDLSGPSPQEIPGEASNQDLFTFDRTDNGVKLSDVKDISTLPIAFMTPTTNASDAKPANLPGGGGGDGYDASSAVSWALTYWDTDVDNGQYRNDCTSFASYVLHYGGGMPFVFPADPDTPPDNDNYWYSEPTSNPLVEIDTKSWGYAHDLWNFQQSQGAIFTRDQISGASPGDLIFADWTSSSTSGISHVGVVTRVTSGNVYITQHTTSRKNEPLYKVSGEPTWQGANPDLHYWIGDPI